MGKFLERGKKEKGGQKRSMGGGIEGGRCSVGVGWGEEFFGWKWWVNGDFHA